MRALLIQPLAPMTYWGFQHSLSIIGKSAPQPPLGLVSLAALLPESWELRIVDLNVQPLRDKDLLWADAVLVTGMLVHLRSMHEVLARARQYGVRSVAGGPAVTARPEDFRDADHVFRGEAEGRLGELVPALESRMGPWDLTPLKGDRPQLSEVPPPRYDLLNQRRYTSMSLQYSRGCPFQCEFCDIVELFGRAPRVKEPAQVLRELDALYETGWRGTVFFVDDNFIGNRRAVMQLLPEVTRWQREHKRPFELYTEASVDLAGQPALVEAMVEAGFATVFLGIETPSAEALREAHKLQNLKLGLDEAVDKLTRAGLEVLAGFIVGFDSDGPGTFEAQRQFISSMPIAVAMVGVLTALPGTALSRRLAAEGRLRDDSISDQFARPNFRPRLDERTLLAGYRSLVQAIYAPDAYYARCEHVIDVVGPAKTRPVDLRALVMLARILVGIGIFSARRRNFWRLVMHALRRPHTIARAMVLAVEGEHLIRYTREDVVPQVDAAIAALEEPLRPRASRSTSVVVEDDHAHEAHSFDGRATSCDRHGELADV